VLCTNYFWLQVLSVVVLCPKTLVRANIKRSSPLLLLFSAASLAIFFLFAGLQAKQIRVTIPLPRCSSTCSGQSSHFQTDRRSFKYDAVEI
jgi:hypothetical protein